jgi:hypothetical protein
MYDHSPVSDLLLRNALVGKLSADDERIYLVQHAGQRDQSRASMPVLRGEGVAEASTELVAISRDSGRRIWTCGGRPVEEIFRNELTSAWFAGPPVVSGRDLYGICEQLDGTSRNAIVSLVCLRAIELPVSVSGDGSAASAAFGSGYGEWRSVVDRYDNGMDELSGPDPEVSDLAQAN